MAVSLLTQPYELTPLSPGLEADVWQVKSDNDSYVLKTWNKQSKPDIGNQYKLLAELHHKGIAVSKPYGWGMDTDDNRVLLTSYDGKPISRLNKHKLSTLARMLVEVHRFTVDSTNITSIPTYDFVAYFYPSIDMHSDIQSALITLTNKIQLSQNSLIHGDYNLGNVLEEDDHYTIIDWTNGQYGDPRYDIALAVFFTRIYAGDRYGKLYFSEFLKLTNYSSEELKIFEAIACLRWILLSRITSLSKETRIFERVKTFIRDNNYLDENLLIE